MRQDNIIDPGSMSFPDIHLEMEKNDWINYLSDQQSEFMDELMWIKWAHGGTEIKYYKQVMNKYSDLYDFGYHDEKTKIDFEFI